MKRGASVSILRGHEHRDASARSGRGGTRYEEKNFTRLNSLLSPLALAAHEHELHSHQSTLRTYEIEG
ncbi:unnamed protein product [Strongylus vulgaris]|uniref:Uncharacterized protein n=1 Tax=Strongylus vulgaris TaxID=40348 RepID=A0A3P7IP60_STRVU|nr:unnamed protein product [Strongylus vulgaris]